MSVTEVIIKIGGAVLFLVGIGVLLSAVGITVPFLPSATTSGNELLVALIGIAMIGFGIYVVRGGTLRV